MLTSNTILRDRYRIIQLLGQGGMGAVYQAMDEGTNRLVAVKETFAKTDDLRRAFRREAELLASVQHPSLPFVIEYFRDGDEQFLVMQFIPGNNLEELLRFRETPFPVDKVLKWADQLLDALEELHANHPPIIHRDIKPSNLKLTPKEKIMLLDFGLAKGFAGDMTTLEKGKSLSSLHAATRHYAPLEQLQGTGTDSRCDLYSFGATLWTLLTNAVPPDALTRLAEQGEGKPDPLRPPHELNPAVPPAVSEVLRQALSIYRHGRPDTAVEMRRALREAVDRTRRLADEEQQREEERRKDIRIRREVEAWRLEEESVKRHKAEESHSQEAEKQHTLAEETERFKREAEITEERRMEAEEARGFLINEQETEWQDKDTLVDAAPTQPSLVSPPAISKMINEPVQIAQDSASSEQTVITAIESTILKSPLSDTVPQAAQPDNLTKSRVVAARSRSLKQYSLIAGFLLVLPSLVISIWLLQHKGDENSSYNSSQTLSVSQSSIQGNHSSQGNEQKDGLASVGNNQQVIIKNGVGMELVLIPAGEFMMGSTEDEPRAAYERHQKYVKKAKSRWDDEMPKHRVVFNKPFYMGKYEVTQGQWQTVMGTNVRQHKDIKEKSQVPSRKKGKNKTRVETLVEGDNYPMFFVSWEDVQAFIGKLNELDDKYQYRLPSEAEWEYAARAGTTGEYAGDIDSLAWYGDNSGRERLNALGIWAEVNGDNAGYHNRLEENGNAVHEVGRKQPNQFGLYDIFGNVWEWCQDWHHRNYKGAPEDGGVWDKGGRKKYRVLRGCSWSNDDFECRSAYRDVVTLDSRYSNTGFRVVAVARY